jgi:hypothetical protein
MSIVVNDMLVNLKLDIDKTDTLTQIENVIKLVDEIAIKLKKIQTILNIEVS